MIDLTTEAGYRQIKWVSAPSFVDGLAPRWTCHYVMHSGEGPLGSSMVVSAPVGIDRIHPSEAAEIAAQRVYEVGGSELQQGERETIRIAVQLQGLEFCAYGVVVKLEPTFEAKEL